MRIRKKISSELYTECVSVCEKKCLTQFRYGKAKHVILLLFYCSETRCIRFRMIKTYYIVT